MKFTLIISALAVIVLAASLATPAEVDAIAALCHIEDLEYDFEVCVSCHLALVKDRRLAICLGRKQ